MKRFLKPIALAALALAAAGPAAAQYTPWLYWTFLPQDQMDLIAGEASGETAWRTIAAINSYNRPRTDEEFKGNFFETRAILERLQAYGLTNAEIVAYPGGDGWLALKGDLWEVKPLRQKLASYDDNVPMLAFGSMPADVTAELVWVGRGTPAEIKAANVEGKIVVTEGNMGSVHGEACQRQGALGVITVGSRRAGGDEFEMGWNSIGLRSFPGLPGDPEPPAAKAAAAPPKTKFGFSLPGREGDFLKSRLVSGQKITASARVETKLLPYDQENVIALLPGSDPGAGEIILSAHLFEGIAKQGANDNTSGSAAILEVARVLQTLVADGRLPRPRRSIRFIWGPEFSGIGRWVQANPAIMERTLCNINMDMVGEWLTKCRAFMCLMRTTYGNPHYINDVLENFYRYVGEGNRERIQNRTAGYPVPRRLVAPFGADEPFYYSIETHYGASDHEVFNDWGVGVPGVMMIAWPDPWYHLAGDLADKSDPTQLKRVAAIGAAAAYTVAAADDAAAIRIAAETAANGARRLGHQLQVALEQLNGATAETLPAAYRAARTYIEAARINERDTLDTILELAADKARVGGYLARMKSSIEASAAAHLAALQAHMEATAARLGTKPAVIVLSDLEKKAARLVPRPTAKVRSRGYRGYNAFINEVPKEQKAKYPQGQFGSPGMDFMGTTPELHCLINGAHSALDIKAMLDAQFTRPANLEHLLNYLQVLKLAGLVEFK